MILFQKKNVN